MTKLEKVAISHNFNFRGWLCFLYLCKNNLQKTLTKGILFVKLIVVLLIYHKMFDVR